MSSASRALRELYGRPLHNSEGDIDLRFSKHALGTRQLSSLDASGREQKSDIVADTVPRIEAVKGEAQYREGHSSLATHTQSRANVGAYVGESSTQSRSGPLSHVSTDQSRKQKSNEGTEPTSFGDLPESTRHDSHEPKAASIAIAELPTADAIDEAPDLSLIHI